MASFPRTIAIGTIAIALSLLFSGMNAVSQTPPADPRPAPAVELLPFSDVQATSGVDFHYESGAKGKHHLPEIMGGGVALLDADGDGRLDIYLCNGGPLDAPDEQVDQTPCCLYLNRGDWKFEDVTEQAGAPGPRYAMGAAVGDYDGDGRDDLFVTGYRDQRLYRNLGQGRFEDVTERAGLVSRKWSTSAAFADLDLDGDLDLYVASYVKYEISSPPYCAAPDGRRDYCGPEDFPAQPHSLHRNNGDGTFTEVSREAGLDRLEGRGLGVLAADLTGDGLPDLYVANDGDPCWLLINQGAMRFRESAQNAGIARDSQGQNLSGMGVALGDLDGDQRVDLVVTNFLGRSTVAFRSLSIASDPFFEDASSLFGLTSQTRSVLGFGIAVEDFDGDGQFDLMQANGHVLDRERLGQPFAMPMTLLRNRGGGRFVTGDGRGANLNLPRLGRGLAIGDLDGDCRPDAVLASLDAPPVLLRNDAKEFQGIAIDLRDEQGMTLVGASVRATVEDRSIRRDFVRGGSYLSASEPRLFIGLGKSNRLDRLEVRWPSGKRESWKGLAAGKSHRLTTGSGEVD